MRTNPKTAIEQINAQYGKLPPQAIDVEEAVLGALMLERDAFEKIDQVLIPESFYKENHQKLFSAVKALYVRGTPIDLLTVVQELKNTNLLEEIGGPLRITELTNSVVSAAHIEFHARIIKQKFIQREIIRIATQIQSMAYDDTQDVDDLISFMSMEVDCLNDGMTGVDEGRLSEQVSKVAMAEIEEDRRRARDNKLVGVDTGFFQLNKSTGGWRSPNLIILAARPSVGKTSLMLHFAIKAAKAGHWVNIYGYEMLAEDLYRIVLSGESDVSRTKIRDGKLDDLDMDKIKAANAILERLPILWYDKSDIKSGRIKSNTKRNAKAGRCEMVFADYLQIIPAEEDRNVREQQISKISRTLKSITIDCKIPVMALAQLSREVERRGNFAEPINSDLRESGSLEQDSDMIIFPYRNEDNDFILKISKYRRGKRGYITIKANDEMTRFWDDVPDAEYIESVAGSKIDPNYGFFNQREDLF